MGCHLCKNEISPHRGIRPDDIEMTEPIIQRMATTEDEPIEVPCRKFQPPVSHTSSLTAHTMINTDHQHIDGINSTRSNGPHQYDNYSESFETISDIESDATLLHENARTQQSSQSMETQTRQCNDAFVQKKRKSKASHPDSSGFHKMNRRDPGILRSSTPVFGSKKSDHLAENFSTQTAYPFSMNISPIQNVSDDELRLHHRTLVVKRNRKLVQHAPKNSTAVIKELVLPDGNDDKHQLISQNTSKIRSVKLMQQILQNGLKSRTDELQKLECRRAILIHQVASSSDDD